jgi:hypothetical protein
MKNQKSDSPGNWMLFLKSVDQKIESWVDFIIGQIEENQKQSQ